MNSSARRPVIAGNWKMYKTLAETEAFFAAFGPSLGASGSKAGGAAHCDLVIAAPFTVLRRAAELGNAIGVAVSAQDLHWEKEGAFTGAISAGMIRDAGCRHTLIGHSERRQFFGETDETVNKKIRAALNSGLEPIVCVGETLAQREAGGTEAVLERQLTAGLAGLTEAEFSPIIIAYEPVWAIGTGRTATPEIAEEAHRFIRLRLSRMVSEDAANRMRILYGGSVKPDNITGLMAQPDLDGALVGGASLDAKSFAAIVRYETL